MHEPFQGEPRIQTVKVNRLEQAVVITIATAGGVDHAMIALGDNAVVQTKTSVGLLHFHGRYGLLRMAEGQPIEAHLVGGSTLSVGALQLEPAPILHGTIVDVQLCTDGLSNGYFDIGERIDYMHGTALIVQHTDGSTQAYNPTRVEPRGNGTRIFVAEDAGFAYSPDGIHTNRFPRRHIGAMRSQYEILSATHYTK